MLISNKIHYFRNFYLLKYTISPVYLIIGAGVAGFILF